MSFLSAFKNFVKRIGYILRDHDKRIAELEIRTACLYPLVSKDRDTSVNATTDYVVRRENRTVAFKVRHIWDKTYYTNDANNPTSGYILKNVILDVYDLTGTTVIKSTTLTPDSTIHGRVTGLI